MLAVLGLVLDDLGMALCAGLVWLLPKVGGREVRGVEDAAFLTEGDSRQFLDPPPSG